MKYSVILFRGSEISYVVSSLYSEASVLFPFLKRLAGIPLSLQVETHSNLG